MVELDHTFDRSREGLGVFGINDGWFDSKNFGNTVTRNRGTREHDKHNGKHQEGHNHLHGILQEGHHIAYLQRRVGYLMCTQPNDEDGQAVH